MEQQFFTIRIERQETRMERLERRKRETRKSIFLEPGEKFLDISRNSDIIIWLAVCRHILAPIPNGGHLSRRRCKYGKGFCQL